VSGDWYQAAGFMVTGWILVSIAGALVIGDRAQHWYTWAVGLLGALSTLAAGTYIARTGLVEGALNFARNFPLLAFILFIVAFVLLAKAAAMGIPDKYHSASFTLAMVMALTFLPAGLRFIPGTFGENVNKVNSQFAAMVNGEAGDWFRPRGDQPGAK
jgi:ABC-type amino acid transport system permease subunit